MIIQPEKIRNVALVGHQGCGKTSLAESLALKAGIIHVKGTVESKNTISDFLSKEKEKLVSLSTSVIPLNYNGYKVNILDLPGNDDFVFETIGVTKLIKGAILVIDASKGVQNGTIKAFKLLKKRGVPMFIFLNKMDKENVNFNELFEEIKEKLDPKKCVPFSYPIGRKENFDGFVNVVELKARKYNGVTCEDDVIYDDKKALIFELHNRLCESVATVNDELLEKFFSGEPLTNEEIKYGLREGVLNGELYPIIVGSALKDIGINTLLTMLVNYLPSPSDLKPVIAEDSTGDEVELKTDTTGPLAMTIFKNMYSSYQGLISVFKVQSGTVKVGDEVVCLDNNRSYKIGNLFAVCGEKLTPVTEVGAGDIGAVSRLDDLHLSYTLSSKDRPVKLLSNSYPTATYFVALVPDSKKDLDKLFQAAERMQLEDPTMCLMKDDTTGQILLGGLSKTHVSYLMEKISDEYKIKFTTEKIKISYRETITKSGEAEGRYVKQTGGAGYFGVVNMRFEPANETSFASTVFGGHIDKSYFPAVEKGFLEALNKGGLIGAPVINVKATLLDGKQHSVDSNEMAFKNAAIVAFRNAYADCKPILLEPYYRIVVNVTNDYLGAALSDLSKRRGRIISTEEGRDQSLDIIAIVPQAEIQEYANELKSITKGTGYFNRTFEDYEPVPELISKEVIKQYNA